MKDSKEFLKKFEPDFEWQVPSKSEKGKFYKVSFSERLGWECSCIAGMMKKECRHKRIKQNELNNNYAEDY